jgi:hypothetical protein
VHCLEDELGEVGKLSLIDLVVRLVDDLNAQFPVPFSCAP